MTKMTSLLTFDNKVILAPMVRVCTLPMRLLALDYGADIVYTEELIDWKLFKASRSVNEVLGTVDFIDPTDGSVIFRTCPVERDRLVLQLGTNDAQRALKVAQMLENDVAGIDINMGCPKEFSIKGGMGAALLSQPQRAYDIVHCLTKSLNIPVTCKIRLLSSKEETLEFVKLLISAGASAVAIHGRMKHERPRHLNRNNEIAYVSDNCSIPIIANGGSREIRNFCDITAFREACKCSSVMVARAAQENCSIFRAEGMLDVDTLIVAYLRYAIQYDNAPSNTKYCIQNILKELQETPRGKRFLECQTLEQICGIWNLGVYCRSKQLEYLKRGYGGRRDMIPEQFQVSLPKRPKLADEHIINEIIHMPCVFIRVNYQQDPDLPKSKVHLYCYKNKLKRPTYRIITENKLFRAVATFQGQQYTSTYWEKNKRYAEQGAAIVLAHNLGLISRNEMIANGTILQ